MAGFRAYFDFRGEVEDKYIYLSPSESRHLIAARRAKLGESVDVFNLDGIAFRTKLVEANAKRAKLELMEKIELETKVSKIILGQAIPKAKTFDDILRQSIEIGIDGVFPILSENCEVKISAKDAPSKREKWQVQIVEAIKQSSNMGSFEFPLADNFEVFLEYAKDFDLKIIASLEEGSKAILNCLRENVESKETSVAILIGPEGDFSAKEYARAREAGFRAVTLGNQVMKAETAALSACAIVSNYILAI
ncbi:MAG: RsmE family RNA methyltransferase [Opitutales bacterium]